MHSSHGLRGGKCEFVENVAVSFQQYLAVSKLTVKHSNIFHCEILYDASAKSFGYVGH